LGIIPKNVAKWRKRTTVEEMKTDCTVEPGDQKNAGSCHQLQHSFARTKPGRGIADTNTSVQPIPSWAEKGSFSKHLFADGEGGALTPQDGRLHDRDLQLLLGATAMPIAMLRPA